MAQALPVHNKARFTGAQTYAEVSVTNLPLYSGTLLSMQAGQHQTKTQESKMKKGPNLDQEKKRRKKK
jgi:phage head maturation protease